MTASSETTSGQLGCGDARTRALLLAIIVLALAIRLFHLVTISHTPFIRFPLATDQTDMQSFWQWSHAILEGDWLGRQTYHPKSREDVAPMETWYRWWGGKTIFHQAPAYPYFLAAMLAVKDSVDWVIAVQLALGALHPLIMFGLARRLFDDRAALLAAVMTAVYGPFIFYEGVLLRDWLPPILEPLALLLVMRAVQSGTATRWMLAGAAMALALLTKETTLAVSAIAVLWLVGQLRRERRPVLRPLGLLLVAGLVCLLPLVIRNVTVGAPPLAVSVQGPGNIILGLSADSPPVGFRTTPSNLELREQARSSMLLAFRAALHSHQGNVLGLLHHQSYKVRALVDALEVPNNVSYGYGREISPVLNFSLGYGLVFPLGIAGLCFLWRRWPKAGLLYWYLIAGVLIQLFTVVLSRFRVAFVPILLLAGAAVLIQLWDGLRDKRYREATVIFTVACMMVLLQRLWAPFSDRVDGGEALSHIVAAGIYLEDRQYDHAVDEIGRFRQLGGPAIEAKSPHVAASVARLDGDIHLRWAFELLDQKHIEQAQANVETAEKAYAVLPRKSTDSYNLGLIYLRLRQRDRARSHLTQYLEREPDGPQAKHVAELIKLLDPEIGSEPADQTDQ